MIEYDIIEDCAAVNIGDIYKYVFREKDRPRFYKIISNKSSLEDKECWNMIPVDENDVDEYMTYFKSTCEFEDTLLNSVYYTKVSI